MVKAVVTDGGANNAYVAGYDIGGKTGTSEKVAQMQTTGDRAYIASFLGFAPIEDAEIAVLVMIDEPRGASHFGGTVAAPVAAEIFKEILPYLGYEPQYTEEELKNYAVKIPELKGKTVQQAKSALTSAGLNINVVGSGETVLKQLPAFGETLNKGGTVIVYTEEGENGKKTAVVPNFIGMTQSEANSAAHAAGLNIKYSGNTTSGNISKAYDQSIPKGNEVAAGTTVTVYFRDESSTD